MRKTTHKQRRRNNTRPVPAPMPPVGFRDRPGKPAADRVTLGCIRERAELIEKNQAGLLGLLRDILGCLSGSNSAPTLRAEESPSGQLGMLNRTIDNICCDVDMANAVAGEIAELVSLKG